MKQETLYEACVSAVTIYYAEKYPNDLFSPARLYFTHGTKTDRIMLKLDRRADAPWELGRTKPIDTTGTYAQITDRVYQIVRKLPVLLTSVVHDKTKGEKP